MDRKEAAERIQEVMTIIKTQHMCKDIDGECTQEDRNTYIQRFEALRMAISALKKQIPKKPIHICVDGIRYIDSYRCPNCQGAFTGTGIARYCHHCGQAIDWEADKQ